MTRTTAFALLLILLSPTACARRALAPTFAKVYRNIMAAQVENRSSRALAPLKGDEAKRIVKAYYGSLTGDSSGGKDDSSSSSSNISSQLPPGPSSTSGNPFAFKTR